MKRNTNLLEFFTKLNKEKMESTTKKQKTHTNPIESETKETPRMFFIPIFTYDQKHRKLKTFKKYFKTNPNLLTLFSLKILTPLAFLSSNVSIKSNLLPNQSKVLPKSPSSKSPFTTPTQTTNKT